MANNIFATRPLPVYSRGLKPTGSEIAAAYTTPQAQQAANEPWYQNDPGYIHDHQNLTGHDTQPVKINEKVKTTTPQYTGNTPDEALDYLASMYTTPEQEEKYRKASVANQRIMAVADALRHIGNIYHTTKGAPAQKFNSPVMEEYGRYRQEKALRDAANYRYLNYKQAKAKQDAAIAKMERDYELRKAESDARANLNEARIRNQEAMEALNKAKEAGQISKNEYQELINKYYPDQAEAKLREIESRIAKNGRSGGRTSGRRGGSGSGGKYYLELPNGTTRYYQTKTMWEKDVDKYYPDRPLEQSSVTTNAEGKQSQTKKPKNYTQRAADGEKKSAANRGGKKSTGVQWSSSNQKSSGGKKSTGVNWH